MELHRLKAALPFRLELKDVATNLGGEAKAFEFLRPGFQRIGHFRRSVGRLEMGEANAPLRIKLALDHAVEPAWTMRTRFPFQRQAGVVPAAWAKPFGGDVLRRRTEAMAHILARDDEIASILVPAAQNDVRVWVVGVPMIDGDQVNRVPRASCARCITSRV